MSKDHNFIKGDYVFAKVRGYPAWPARIEAILDPRPATLKYNVFFFGTSETAAVQAKEVYPYLSNKDKYGKTIKRKFFNEGIQELEEELRRIKNGESLLQKDSVSTTDPTIPNSDEHQAVLPIQALKADESVVTKRKRKISDATKAAENEGEVSAKRKRKSSAVIPREKIEENVAKGKSKSVSGATHETGEDDHGEDGQDTVPDKRKVSSNKILKNKSDGSGENIDNQEGEGRKRKRSTMDSDSIALKEQISRSGRRIKPKKFIDDEENKEELEGKERSGKGKMLENETKDGEFENNEEAQKAEPVSPQKKRKSKDLLTPNKKEGPELCDMGRIIWVKAKTGDMVQIKIDHTLPDTIKSVKHRAQYDLEYQKKLNELKEKIEHGEVMTHEVMIQLKPSPESLASMTEEEIEFRKNRRSVERKFGRSRWLKLESRLVTLDVYLRSALQKEKANVEEALKLLDEYINLPIDPLMIKKNPQLVETVKKLIYYTGNAKFWNYSTDEATDFNKKALKIRQKALTLSNKFRSIFTVSKRADFWCLFQESLNKFRDATDHLSPDLLYEITLDPSSPYYDEVAECDREDREHDLSIEKSLESSEAKEN